MRVVGKKILIVSLFFAGLVGLAPFVVGLILEAKIESFIESDRANNTGITLELERYDRGWLSAHAKVVMSAQKGVLAEWSGDVGMRPVLELRVQHGPLFVFSDVFFSWGHIRGELAANSFNEVKETLQIENRLLLEGDYYLGDVAHMSVSPFVLVGKGGKIIVRGSDIEWEERGDAVNARLSSGAVSVIAHSQVVKMSPASVSLSYDRSYKRGELDVLIDQIASPTSLKSTLGGVDISIDVLDNIEGVVDSRVSMNVETVQSRYLSEKLEPFNVDVLVRRFNYRALIDMFETKFDEQRIASDKKELLSEKFYGLVSSGLGFTLNDFGFSVNERPKFNLKGELGLDREMLESSGFSRNKAAYLNALVADLRLNLDRDVVLILLSRFFEMSIKGSQLAETDKSLLIDQGGLEPVKTLANDLIKKGYFRFDGEVFSSEMSLSKNNWYFFGRKFQSL